MPSRETKRPVPVVNPRLRVILAIVFTLFALLAVNALYLGSITFLEWSSGNIYQDYFYLLNMLFHLGGGPADHPAISLVRTGAHAARPAATK